MLILVCFGIAVIGLVAVAFWVGLDEAASVSHNGTDNALKEAFSKRKG